MTGLAHKKQLDIWGEKLQIWLDTTQEGESSSDKISRFWTGESSDVSEVIINDEFGQKEASSMVGLVPWILLRYSNWSMVPVENIVAVSRGTGTRIAVAIDNEIELNGVSHALGLGVDAVLVPSSLIAHAENFAEDRLETEKPEPSKGASLVYAEVTSVVSSGMGERACVDLTRRLEIGQGMAIGSVSSSLCLIHGETIESVFVPTRPFRVNAGAIHSYVLMADGKTKYLSELVSGDEVAILSKNGIEDSSTVGRVKIENRPLLMVRFSTSESEGQIILQQAETVRLVSSETDLISVTEIEIGDRILIISDNRFRHTGIAIDGDVVER